MSLEQSMRVTLRIMTNPAIHTRRAPLSYTRSWSSPSQAWNGQNELWWEAPDPSAPRHMHSCSPQWPGSEDRGWVKCVRVNVKYMAERCCSSKLCISSDSPNSFIYIWSHFFILWYNNWQKRPPSLLPLIQLKMSWYSADILCVCVQWEANIISTCSPVFPSYHASPPSCSHHGCILSCSAGQTHYPCRLHGDLGCPPGWWSAKSAGPPGDTLWGHLALTWCQDTRPRHRLRCLSRVWGRRRKLD